MVNFPVEAALGANSFSVCSMVLANSFLVNLLFFIWIWDLGWIGFFGPSFHGIMRDEKDLKRYLYCRLPPFFFETPLVDFLLLCLVDRMDLKFDDDLTDP